MQTKTLSHGAVDVHRRAWFADGAVHWQMALGPDAISVRISASALHALGPTPLPGYLSVFEENRELLCAIAAAKIARIKGRLLAVEIDAADVQL